MSIKNQEFIGADGIYSAHHKAQARDSIKAPQQDEIDLCKEWLLEYGAKNKQINRKGSNSNAFKYYVEWWLCSQERAKDISNGAFIQAAIDLGYNYKKMGLNAKFNIGSKGVNRFFDEMKWVDWADKKESPSP